MGCFPPMPLAEEAILGMYITNLYCAIKGLPPFIEEKNDEKVDLNDFKCSVRRILAHNKALMSEGGYVCLDEREIGLQQFCDEIVDILFSRRKDLREMKIKGNNQFLLFLDQTFDFFLSEKNLPSFINLIFSLMIGGSIFTKGVDWEKNCEWLDGFEFKV